MTSSYTDVAGVKRTHEVKGQCSACRTTGTPTWRWGCSSSYHGKLLCNRCGLADRKGKLENFSDDLDQLRLQNKFTLGFATAPSAGPPDYVIATFWLTDSATIPSDSSTSHDPRDDGMAGSDDDELSAYPVDPGHAAFGVGMQDLLDSEAYGPGAQPTAQPGRCGTLSATRLTGDRHPDTTYDLSPPAWYRTVTTCALSSAHKHTPVDPDSPAFDVGTRMEDLTADPPHDSGNVGIPSADALSVISDSIFNPVRSFLLPASMTQWTDDVGPSPSGATSGPRPSSVEETQQGGVEGDSESSHLLTTTGDNADGTDPRISNSLYYEEIRSPQTQNDTFVSPQRPSRQMYTFEEGAYAHIHQLALQHRMSGNVHSLSLETAAVEEPEAFGNIGNTRVRSPGISPSRQYSSPSEMYVADMHALLHQLGSSVENLQSISNTFVIDTRVVENGSTVFTLLDIVLLTSGQQGICCSEITGLWDDAFRRQGIFTMLRDDPVVRDTSYAHSRLIPSSNQGRGSPRVLRFANDHMLEFQVLESGNSAFSLPRHQAIEATLDYFHLHNSVSHKMAINCLTILISSTEDLCEEWLIGVLGVASLLPSRAQKEAYIAIHKQYMVDIAEIEEKAANQANYYICPLTSMRYQDMTVMAQTAMHNLGNSITSSIGAEEMDNKRIPSPQETDFVRFFGRTMAQWQIAFFLLETEPRKAHQSYMKAVLAPLRNKFFSMSSHSLVPNYPGELRNVCSGRRTELARCLLRGVIPPPFNLQLSTTPWVMPATFPVKFCPV